MWGSHVGVPCECGGWPRQSMPRSLTDADHDFAGVFQPPTEPAAETDYEGMPQPEPEEYALILDYLGRYLSPETPR